MKTRIIVPVASIAVIEGSVLVEVAFLPCMRISWISSALYQNPEVNTGQGSKTLFLNLSPHFLFLC